jgi:hypothetical protein
VCITDGTADYVSPEYGPDAKSVAFLSNKTSFGGTWDLWQYDFGAAKAGQLSQAAKVRNFCWLDASTILYSAVAGDTGRIWALSVATHAAMPFIATSGPRTWAESGVRVIAAGAAKKVIYTREYNDGVKRIYWVNPDGTGDQAVVNSATQDWLE